MSELCYIFSLHLSTENFGEEQAEGLAFKGSYGLTPKHFLTLCPLAIRVVQSWWAVCSLHKLLAEQGLKSASSLVFSQIWFDLLGLLAET